MLYLANTGCNNNLTSKQIFDWLPKHIKDQLMDCDTQAEMADGTRLSFYKVEQISINVRNVKLEEAFVGSQINEDAILAKHNCRMNY